MRLGEVIIRLVPSRHDKNVPAAELVLLDNHRQEVKVLYRAFSTTTRGALVMLEETSGVRIPVDDMLDKEGELWKKR